MSSQEHSTLKQSPDPSAYYDESHLDPPVLATRINPPSGRRNKASVSNAGPTTNSTSHATPRTCVCKREGRNIAVFIDGTANQFGAKNTNIVELYSMILRDDDYQATYYNSGIGTFAKPRWKSLKYMKQRVYHWVDTAIAWNFERIVMNAYQWLVENYKPGDRIFLFGFSRGAYQVRVIAGMIEKVGLLHKGNNDQIPFAFELYSATTSGATRPTEPQSSMASASNTSLPSQSPSPLSDPYPSHLPSSLQASRAHTMHLPSQPPPIHSELPSPSASQPPSSRPPSSRPPSSQPPSSQPPSSRPPSVPSHAHIAWGSLLPPPIPSLSGSQSRHIPFSTAYTDQVAALATVSDDPEELCKQFKKTLSREGVKVHFVGVWDTVSSIGITRGPSLPETVDGMKHVCVFRHALALDERRVKFLPEYVNGGVGCQQKADVSGSDVKEVWFVGSHSDIGGGNVINMNLSNFGPALRWMVHEARNHGLRFGPKEVKWSRLEPKQSLTSFWRVLEVLPFRHLTYRDPNGKQTTIRPHLGHPRIITSGQLIHKTVIMELANNEKYNPRAILPGGISWRPIDSCQLQGMVEADEFASPSRIITKLKHLEQLPTFDGLDISVLKFLASSDSGRKDIANVPDASIIIMKAFIQTDHLDPNQRSELAECLIKALRAFQHLQQPRLFLQQHEMIHQFFRFRHIFSWLHSPSRMMIPKLARHFGDCLLDAHEWPNRSIECIAFRDGCGTIVAALDGAAVGIWDLKTKQQAPPITVPLKKGFSVAYTDDLLLAGCGQNTNGQMHLLRRGHHPDKTLIIYGNINPGARRNFVISPDGKDVAASLRGGGIQIWNTETGRPVFPPMPQSRRVESLSFSSDGLHLVAVSMVDVSMPVGHRDIQLWDTFFGNKLGSFKADNSGYFWSVAVSAGATHVIAGSADKSIYLWDSQHNLKRLTGHFGPVFCVAFSPDSRLFASGSADGTVRIWDVSLGRTLAECVVGDWVQSIAFSRDSKQLVSGSNNGQVHIWDTDVVF